jgi:adenylate cyclase
VLFDFLGVSDPGRSTPRMDPEARQRRFLALLKRVARAQSAREPSVTLVEDLHWLDPAARLPDQPGRGDRREREPGRRQLPPGVPRALGDGSFYRQIALARWATSRSTSCSPAARGRPLARRAGPAHPGAHRGQPVLRRGARPGAREAGSLEGERGAYRLAAPVTSATVPSSVQAVLAARIDRLAARDKAVAAGRRRHRQGVRRGRPRAVAELPPAELVAALQAAARGEFVDEREPEPEALYAFRHPLTREVAYARSCASGARACTPRWPARTAELYPERLNERARWWPQHWEAAGAASGGGPLVRARRRVGGHRRPGAGPWHTGPRSASWPTALPDAPEYLSLRLTARMYAMQFGWRLGVSQAQARAAFEEAEQLAVRAGRRAGAGGAAQRLRRCARRG